MTHSLNKLQTWKKKYINKEFFIKDEFFVSDSENNSDDEADYIKNDPVRKFQFDHNVSTCLTNKFPEMMLDDDGNECVQEDNDFAFAPGEGKVPKSILNDKDWDIKAWPSLHPDGKYGLHQERNTRLTDQKYFVQRIRNIDRRFEENPGYVFAAAAYIEKKRLQSNANISFSRGKKSIKDDGGTEYTLNDPFTVFDNLKNSPKYWQKFKYEMMAKLENLGPFQWFFTLSCADRRWDENFSSLLAGQDHIKLEYIVRTDGTSVTLVNFLEEGKEETMELHQYLQQKVDESEHELIRRNVLNSTRNFQHRVNSFVKEIILGDNNPMKIKNLSYKVEFQGRGAGHIHGVLWTRLSDFEEDSKHLKSAFRNLREGNQLTIDERDELANFVDKFITCSMNPDKLSQYGFDGKKLVELALEVQQHSHTRTCHKYDDTCRFHKPTFPMKKTTIFQSSQENKDDGDNREGENPEILKKIKELLDDKDVISRIMEKYNKLEESEEEYIRNRNERIDTLMKIAGTDYAKYTAAIKASVIHGHMILLERDIDEGYINAFNPEWLEAWGGNIDLQPCLDYFAVITYVTDYLTKDDTGLTAILREVIKKSGTEDQKEQMQSLIHTFLTHRQMGQAEAYFKIIPSLKMKFSTVRTVYLPTEKKELRSRFLLKVGEKEDTLDKIAFTVNGRDGIFIEKSDVIEKYIRRSGPKNEFAEFKETDTDCEALVCSQFAKMMETSKKSEIDEGNEIDEEQRDIDSDDIKFHYIMTPNTDENNPGTLLPNFMRLLPKYPGKITS